MRQTGVSRLAVLSQKLNTADRLTPACRILFGFAGGPKSPFGLFSSCGS